MMGYCAREQLRFWSKHATDVVGSPADVQPNNHRIYGHAEGLTRYILRGCEALALVRKSPSASAGRGTHGNITFVCSLYRKPGISIWVRQQQQLSSLSGPAIDFVLEGPSCVHLNYVQWLLSSCSRYYVGVFCWWVPNSWCSVDEYSCVSVTVRSIGHVLQGTDDPHPYNATEANWSYVFSND